MHLKKANQFFRQGEYTKSIEEYNKISTKSPLYPLIQFNIKLALEYIECNVKSNLNLFNDKEGIGYYRIIGNSIGELHLDVQGLLNLKHIVEYESMFDGFEKWFIINRLVNKHDQKKIIDYLEEHNLNYKVINFNLKEYMSIGYDFGILPNNEFWFSKKNNWTNLVTNMAIRKSKNSYLMNNNGARNFALKHGKDRYKWTMPWDGNCFLSDSQFEELNKSFNLNGVYKYICTPMERAIDNSNILSSSHAKNAVEESQISFRFDSEEIFNEDMVYGNKPKVELFKRLNYPGKWDEFVKLYPWQDWIVKPSKDINTWFEQGSVFRLSSGNAETATSGSKRSHIRAHGISDTIDEVETLFISNNNIEKSKKLLRMVLFSYFSQQCFDINVKASFYKNSKKKELLYILCKYSQNLLDKKTIDNMSINYEINYQDFNFRDINIFSGKFYETFISLIIHLECNDLHKAIKIKLELVMMIHYYFASSNTEFLDDEIELIMQLLLIIFEKVFCYNINKDFSKINLSCSLKDTSDFILQYKKLRCQFISKRSDGFGERIRSLLNAMALSDYYATEFKFEWRQMPKKYHEFHSVITKEETFVNRFLKEYHLNDSKSLEIKDIEKFERLEDLLNPNIFFSVHQNTYKSDNFFIKNAFRKVNYKEIFNRIEFSNKLNSAYKEAEKIILDNTIAIHLRAGDIVYGGFRFTDKYTTKVIPFTIAIMLISKLKQNGYNILLFGQDQKICHWICDYYKIQYVNDYLNLDYDNEQKSLFEIILMSKCLKVYGGSSGFAILATMIGNIKRIDPKNEFLNEKIVRQSLEILKEQSGNDFIPKLQVSYSCNWLLNRYENILSSEEYFFLTDLGIQMDSSNYMFPFLKLSKLYKLNLYKEAEEYLNLLIINNKEDFESFLSLSYGPKHKLEYFIEKHIKYFEIASKKGLKNASYLLNKSRINI